MEVLKTQDGSSTILSNKYNVTYHSRFGAIQESQHVFIQNGLLPVLQSQLDQIKILEIGFGTGLNFLLTHLVTFPKTFQLKYTALDLVPLKKDIIHQINYISQLNLNVEYEDFFYSIHSLPWSEWHQLDQYTHLKKELIDLVNYQPTCNNFNVIYFDAFAPSAQPELWETNVLEKIYHSLVSNGILVTYCAKGSVKRTFKNLGGLVESLPGPPGKREMIRITKLT